MQTICTFIIDYLPEIMRLVSKSFLFAGLLIGLANILFFILLSNRVYAAPKPEVDADAKTLATGKKIYDKICWACHGMHGKGDGPVSITLTVKPANFENNDIKGKTDDQLFNSIYNGYKTMNAYKGNLTKEEVNSTVAYIRKLQVSN